MHTTGLCSRTHITTAIGWIIGSLVLIAFCTSNTAIAKPLTFLSPQQIPPAFLSVPYYGAKSVNSYFDHEFPDYLRNNRIVLYDGRIARHENGDCGWNSQGNPIAYFTQPGGQGQCIWYDGHPAMTLVSIMNQYWLRRMVKSVRRVGGTGLTARPISVCLSRSTMLMAT